MSKLSESRRLIIEKTSKWADEHYYAIAIFNLVVIFLFLLHSVGYFHPFFPITINFIVLAMFALAVVLLRVRSSVFFVIAIFFWVVSAFFKYFQINVWAERSGIYVFEALVIGVILLLWENFSIFKKK